MFEVNKYSIGATAAIMTSMGLIAGLTQGSDAKVAIVSGLLIIVVADNISDSFSIHMYRESEGASVKEVYLSTFGNFAMRFIVALSFAATVLVFQPRAAFMLSSLWGLLLLALFSYRISVSTGKPPWRSTIWHLCIACMVIISSKVLGSYVVSLVAR
jgi:VIT1/CCC1 family predicted Fe2+/Mn2+ transporter